jgi:hypothetical protein
VSKVRTDKEEDDDVDCYCVEHCGNGVCIDRVRTVDDSDLAKVHLQSMDEKPCTLPLNRDRI